MKYFKMNLILVNQIRNPSPPSVAHTVQHVNESQEVGLYTSKPTLWYLQQSLHDHCTFSRFFFFFHNRMLMSIIIFKLCKIFRFNPFFFPHIFGTYTNISFYFLLHSRTCGFLSYRSLHSQTVTLDMSSKLSF